MEINDKTRKMLINNWRINEDVAEILFDKCNRLNRFISIPGIYRHFKGYKNGEEMLYAVSNISMPMESEEFSKMIKNGEEALMMHHTEVGVNIVIIREGDRYYHNKGIDPEMLVMYTALYGDRESYLRPLPMFLSKTDKEKYPNAIQKYRLEEI